MIVLRNIIYSLIVLLAVGLTLWLVPLWQTKGLEGAYALALEIQARMTLAIVLLGALLMVCLGFFWRHLAFGRRDARRLDANLKQANEELLQQLSASQRQAQRWADDLQSTNEKLLEMSQESLRVARETLLLSKAEERTDRYLRAAEHLAGECVQERLGAVYALERLAREAADEHWPIMQILTAHVRTNTAWFEAAPAELFPAHSEEKRCMLAPDVQAALTVIGRRSPELAQNENERLDLSGADLRGADLRGALLIRADLEHARLEGADLEGACLEGARLTLCRLEGAHLLRVNLQGADLTLAHLERAHLWEADLSGAELSLTQLHEADFWKTKLHGAQLSRAIGMTRRQLDASLVDRATSLPQFFLATESGDQSA